jgi:hypothetical protein
MSNTLHEAQNIARQNKNKITHFVYNTTEKEKNILRKYVFVLVYLNVIFN